VDELDQFYYKNDGLLNDQNGSRVENWTRERVKIKMYSFDFRFNTFNCVG